ncbi:protein TBATA [Polymixia lowei]
MTALLSEAWREELKELAAKVSLSSQVKKDKKDKQLEDGSGRRKTQYSAQTGRIIPPSSKAYQSRSHSKHLVHQPFHDQELMVLELLCQILQTDSLSMVQQWLLLAGQREKDLVMGLIQQALEDIEVSGHHRNNTIIHPSHTNGVPVMTDQRGSEMRRFSKSTPELAVLPKMIHSSSIRVLKVPLSS